MLRFTKYYNQKIPYKSSDWHSLGYQHTPVNISNKTPAGALAIGDRQGLS